MVDLAELQAVAYVAQIVGVAGTLTAAFIAVRSYINANKHAEEAKKKEQETRDRDLDTRQAQLFTQIFNLYISSGFSANITEIMFNWEWTDFEDFRNKYGDRAHNKEVSRIYTDLETYIEGLGVLVKRGLVDPEFIEDFMGGDLITYWEKMLPITKGMRETYLPTWGEYPEYLYNEMKRIRDKQHPELKTKPP